MKGEARGRQGDAAGCALTGKARAELHARLLDRREEIAQAALTRVYAISDPTQAGDPTYLEGLRSATAAAVDYGLSSILSTERSLPKVPAAILIQARLAARSRISLDIVMRRYLGGYALFGDFVLDEAEQEGLDGAELKSLLRVQAGSFERLLAAVSDEYGRESGDHPETAKARRAKLAGRLLAGERLDASELGYDFEVCHIGVIATGPGIPRVIRELSVALDRRLLLIDPGDGTHWAWLGGREELDPAELGRHLPRDLPESASLVIGEPAAGLAGWRLTHRQAKAALPIALRTPQRPVRYADVAILASMLTDDLLTSSLRQLFLEPLGREGDGGKTARRTLRAYLDANRNASSAAAALGVDRHTVGSRLRAIEKRLNRPLYSCVTEITAALRLEDLGHLPPS
ncbi:MAG TPA: helix-turn-helix domain-containing protein [Solirubrobacterales bacterium]|nr:helix-turn-helix domain-containing protein [Solirubrobacterales bacterium]